MKKIVKIAMSLLLVGAFAVSPFIDTIRVYAEGADESSLFGGGKSSSSSTEIEPTKSTSKGTRVVHSAKVSKIKDAKEVSKDVKGWLTVPGTNMDMPIVLGGKDNVYYNTRTWEGKDYPKNDYTNFKETSTFLDFRTKINSTWKSSSKNMVLYGHNWTNLREPMAIGTNNNHIMFGQLPSYTNKEFAEQNPYIYFSTDKNEGIWKVFAVAYVENDYSKFAYNTPDPTKEEFKSLLSELKARSMYNYDFDVKESDRILTLSTCTRKYDNIYNGQRFIVVARLLREGESDTDAVKITVNPNPKQGTYTKK